MEYFAWRFALIRAVRLGSLFESVDELAAKGFPQHLFGDIGPRSVAGLPPVLPCSFGERQTALEEGP